MLSEDSLSLPLSLCPTPAHVLFKINKHKKKKKVALSFLTYRQEAPRDSRSGEAGEHVVGAGEVREVRQDHGLAPALAPHVHVPALGLGSRRVGRVAGRNLYYPEMF